MTNTLLSAATALMLGIDGASAANLRAHVGYNPGTQIDAAYLGSVPVGGFRHDVHDDSHGALTGGPVGGFTDRN